MISVITVPGTTVDRILKLGVSPIDVLFDKVYDRHDIVVDDSIVPLADPAVHVGGVRECKIKC